VKISPESARLSRIGGGSPRQCNRKCNERDSTG